MKRKRIILIVIVLGSVYGLVSAILNRNPYYPIFGQHNVPDEDMAKAWHWEPSPSWLPSYLLCKVAKHSQGNWAGIYYTKSGYLFRTRYPSDFLIYSIASTIIGSVIGMLLAGVLKRAMKGTQAKTKPLESKLFFL